MYYYVQPIIFIELPDFVVPVNDKLPSTQTNSVKEDGENYSPSGIFIGYRNGGLA